MPSTRGLLFIGLAILIGLAAAWTAMRLTPSVATPTVATTAGTAPVVTARTGLDAATTITVDQLDVVQWPREHVPGGAIVSVELAAGRVLRRPLAAGEPVLESAVFPIGSAGGLSALISPNSRAVSVKVDNVIGVAGFVQPGARVDVFATLRRVDTKEALPYSKLILQDVRVLAVDQQLEKAGATDPVAVSVATLEVDPVQAERLIYAAHEGRLQLALRTPGDVAIVETDSVGVADVLLDRRPKATSNKPAFTRRAVGPTVQVLRGDKLETKSFN